MHTYRLPAGAMAEAWLEARAGAEVRVTFAASAALAWDVHVHAGDSVRYLVAGTDAAVDATVVADVDGPLFVLWVNPSAQTAIDVAVMLRPGPGARLVSW